MRRRRPAPPAVAKLGLALVALAPTAPLWPSVARIDERLLATVVAHRRLAWRRSASALTDLAAPATVTVLTVACAGVAYRRHAQTRAIESVLARAAFGILTRRVLAEAVRRQRPPSSWWWAEPSGSSYPSRHTTWAALGYGAVADLLDLAGVPRPVARTVPLAAVTTVAATRVMLAVHWPSDVVAAVVYSTSWRRVS